MKKHILIITALCFLFGVCAAADELPENTEADTEITEIASESDEAESIEPSAEPEEDGAEEEAEAVIQEVSINNISNTIDFDITLLSHEYTHEGLMELELYSMNDELLASFDEWITDTSDRIYAHFDIPDYTLGESFKLKLVGGINSLKYYDTLIYAGNSFTFQTYGYLDENSNYIRGDEFAVEGDPYYEKGVNIYIDDDLFYLSPRARLVDGYTMVPVRQVAEALGLKVTYDKEYDSVVCSVGSNEIIFNIGTTYSTILGETVYAPHEPCYIDGSIYVPVRTLAEGISSSIDVYDFGEHLDVVLGDSELVDEFRSSSPVNSVGLSSDTAYLIWVSKHEFKTRVYLGSKYNWELIKEFPCAIGADESETITGTFKYLYRDARWDYDGYYVGPALVFYGGYALHSTLLNYGGGEYDGTVGAKISHGCVRLHPDDINWIDCFVPVGSTIYVTE